MAASNSVHDAHTAVVAAEQKLRDAERARDAAYDILDAALHERGWRRFWGAFSQRLYTSVYGSNPMPLPDVLEAEAARERTAAA